MARLFENLTGQTFADQTSRAFRLERSTKQGDLLNPALFNAVLESVMRNLKPRWRSSRLGIFIGPELLNNLLYADDILLIGRSRAQVKHMLEDLSQEASKLGPKLHMGKTNILLSCGQRWDYLSEDRGHVLLGQAAQF